MTDSGARDDSISREDRPAAPVRRKARILAMQMLCQLEVLGDDAMRDLPDFLEESGISRSGRRYTESLVRDSWQDRSMLDARIEKALTGWTMDRMSPVERNIIRVAVSEIMSDQVPMKVAIDEAIDIGRTFGGADSPRFINGVLDAVYRTVREEMGDGPV